MTASAIPGTPAIELAKTFPEKFPDVRFFYLKRYPPTAGAAKKHDLAKLATFSGKTLVKHRFARRIADLLKGIDVDESTSWIKVPADQLAAELARLKAECRKSREGLALCSMCEDAAGRKLHIPMLDFRIGTKGDYGQIKLLTKALRHSREEDGAIVNSGDSYHYYGFRLLSPDDWQRFMAAWLLLGPLVDVRYIGHRLMARTAALRLNAAPPLKPKEPWVVRSL